MRKNVTVEKILLEFEPEKQNLLLALKKINFFFGYIGEEDAKKVAEYFDLSMAKIFEVAGFYDLIKIEKPVDMVIKVCSGSDCSLSGSTDVIREIENYFHIKVGDKFNPKVRLEKISCLGRCYAGPILLINEKIYERVTVGNIYQILKEWV